MTELIQKYQIIAALLLLVGIVLLWHLRHVISILLAAYVFAATLVPLVEYVAKRIPRILAIFSVYGGILAAFIAAALLLVAPLREGFVGLKAFLAGSKGPEGMLPLPDLPLPEIIGAGGANILGIAGGLGALLGNVLIAIIASIYIVYDWHRMRSWVAGRFRNSALARKVIDAQVDRLGRWFRGQLALSVFVAVMVWLALTVIGIPNAPVLGFVAGIFELVPYASIIAAIPAVLIALTMSGEKALAVIVAYVVIQQVESHLLVPLVMQRAVQLPAIVVIAAVLTGFAVLGIWGSLLALPLASLAAITISTIQSDRKATR